MSEAIWQERLNEATVRLEPEVTADVCAERYDIDDRDDLEDLTNAALEECRVGVISKISRGRSATNFSRTVCAVPDLTLALWAWMARCLKFGDIVSTLFADVIRSELLCCTGHHIEN